MYHSINWGISSVGEHLSSKAMSLISSTEKNQESSLTQSINGIVSAWVSNHREKRRNQSAWLKMSKLGSTGFQFFSFLSGTGV
jgi:hypothetical protein